MATEVSTNVQHEHPPRPYFKILIILAVITAIEVTTSELGIPAYGAAIIAWLLIVMALIKAVTIIAFYMHIKYEKSPLKVFSITFVIPFLMSFLVAFFPLVG